VIVLILLATVGTGLLVDLDFFDEVHHSNVFTTILWTRVLLFFLAALLGALAVGVNLVVGYAFRPAYVAPSQEQRQLEAYRLAIGGFRRVLTIVVTALGALVFGLVGQGRWETWLLYLHGQSFGETDAQFHRDISYYTFTLPFERMVLGFLLAAVIVSIIVATAIHYLYAGIRTQVSTGRFSNAARAHLSVLLGLLLVLKACFYWLDRYSLVFSNRGESTGASYTDVHASIPARTILVFVAIICALLFFANAVRPRTTLAAAGFVTMALSALLVGGAFPFAVQQLHVKPNAINLEATYISRGIQATRQAYRIEPSTQPGGTVDTTSFNAPTEPVASAVTPTATNIANARLLDPNKLQQTFEQLQQIRSYYSFPQQLDIDRYTVDGQEQSYVIATRDVNLAGIQQKNWPNEHLVYTHGTGIVAAETSQIDANGRPVFAVKGLPATGSDGVSAPPITITQPRIYYGELSPKYSVVDTKQPEVDGTGTADYHYQGDGGVAMGSKLGTRLVMALHFKDYNLLFSSAVTKSSRIMYYRDPRERVQKVAPWLTLDGDPYPAVIDGRIEWIVDGYTTTDDYPYSQRVSLSGTTTTAANLDASNVATQSSRDINYIRNSVKATVDAYTGKVTLYAFEQGTPDPILRTWEKIFPGVITPESQIPADLRAHFRYPEDLFNIQRNLLAKYHVTDPKAFFNGNGFWQVANDPVTPATAQASYYQEFQMPGESGPEFNLATSLTFNQRPNLAAFVAVSSDPADYGTIRVLQLPDSSVINGPANVEAAIRSDPQFGSQYTLLNQNGSKIISGNLLTLPVGGGLLFVQPFYTQATGTTSATSNDSFPLLRYVVVVYGDKVGYASTLAGAISAAVGGAAATTPVTSPTLPTSPTTPTPSTTPPVSGSVAALQAQVSADFAAAAAALSSGNLGAYQAAVAKAQSDYQKLLAAGGAMPTGSATISPTPTTSP
jgi:uncharacterized membrane protein (UPF0182 family)